MITSRRGLLLGAMSSLAAPVIVKAEILMPIRPQPVTFPELIIMEASLDRAVLHYHIRKWVIRIHSVGGVKWETEWRHWEPGDVSLAA